MPIVRIPTKGGMAIPNIGSLDPATHGFGGEICLRCIG